MTASVSIDPAVRREVQSDYFRYLLPTLIGQIAHSFYCMADVFFVGAAVGSDGLAALNVALPVFTLFSAFSLMVGVGTATTASILTGQGQTQQTNRVFTQSMVLLAVVGLTLTLLTSVFIVPLARVFGATDRILTEVVDYMRPINLLAFAYIFSGALGVIIRADGNPRLVMIAGTTGNICNIVLDYVFTMKLGMGMFGAGLATILGHCVAVLLYLLHFALHQNHLHLTRNFFDPAACVRVLRNGIGSSILDFPYTPLVSVVVGVTNVIPFFGPFLGAIPCAFLILLDSPMKCLYFIIFIIVLQQFDGNILGPKILGDSTGISSFWVIVAILVGGGLWGIVGMFVGVPLFACIYTAIRKYTAWRLEQKGLPTDSRSYREHGPKEDREKTP